MKKIKIIIYPIIAALFGLITARILQAGILPTILLSLLLWLGTTLIQVDKYKDSEPIPEEKPSASNYIQRSLLLSDRIKKKADEIEDQTLQMYIRSVAISIDKIAEAVKADPSKFDKNRKVFDYYIPSIYRFIKQYDEIENQELTSKSSKEYMQKVKGTIIMIDKAFKNILNNIYEYDIMDSTADVQVLENLLKMEGNANE